MSEMTTIVEELLRKHAGDGDTNISELTQEIKSQYPVEFQTYAEVLATGGLNKLVRDRLKMWQPTNGQVLGTQRALPGMLEQGLILLPTEEKGANLIKYFADLTLADYRRYIDGLWLQINADGAKARDHENKYDKLVEWVRISGMDDTVTITEILQA